MVKTVTKLHPDQGEGTQTLLPKSRSVKVTPKKSIWDGRHFCDHLWKILPLTWGRCKFSEEIWSWIAYVLKDYLINMKSSLRKAKQNQLSSTWFYKSKKSNAKTNLICKYSAKFSILFLEQIPSVTLHHISSFNSNILCCVYYTPNTLLCARDLTKQTNSVMIESVF